MWMLDWLVGWFDILLAIFPLHRTVCMQVDFWIVFWFSAFKNCQGEQCGYSCRPSTHTGPLCEWTSIFVLWHKLSIPHHLLYLWIQDILWQHAGDIVYELHMYRLKKEKFRHSKIKVLRVLLIRVMFMFLFWNMQMCGSVYCIRKMSCKNKCLVLKSNRWKCR